MSNNHRWSKFWWQDWQNDPQLKVCGHLAKGVWMDLLCLMAQSEPAGHLVINGRAPDMEELGVLIGMPEEQLAGVMQKLERNGVFSRTAEGIIYNRRMVRDVAASEAGREHVAKRWNGEERKPHPKGDPTSPPNRDPTRGATVRPSRGATRDPTSPPNTLEARSKKLEARVGGSLPLTPFARARKAGPNEGGKLAKTNGWGPLPEHWEPPPEAFEFAARLGFNAEQALIAAENMRDWAHQKLIGSFDWNRRFENWLQTETRRERQRRRSAEKSQSDQIREAGKLPSLLRVVGTSS